MISGKIVKIYSGISIIDVGNKKEVLDYEISKAKIKTLQANEIEEYIKTGEPLDKA
jgi:septum formation protein